MTSNNKNIRIVLDILKDEVDGDIASALKKMAHDYSMTWMYKKGNTLFPSVQAAGSKELKEVYPIKGRVYDIRNIVEKGDIVMVEMIESYPDPETGKMYRTPQVLVLEMENGKIKKGRHYCDPALSFTGLTEAQIDEGLKGAKTKEKIQ